VGFVLPAQRASARPEYSGAPLIQLLPANTAGQRVAGVEYTEEYSRIRPEGRFAAHESYCTTMDFTKDPNDRRRIPQEAMNQRDAEVARLRRAGVAFRAIGERLDMSLGAVQKALARAQKRSLEHELDAALAGYANPDMLADDARTPADVAALDSLQYYRLRHLPPDHPARDAWRQAVAAGYRRPRPEPTTYPVGEQSWRAGVAVAKGDDSGAADDEF
jgi:DNA-binding CsgD family transcriptional regulator